MDASQLQQSAAHYVDQIEAEMRSIGLWQDKPLRPAQLNFKKAFAMDTMTFAQWLQFIFLVRVREAIASSEFPSSSSVGAQAVREFDAVRMLIDCSRYFQTSTRCLSKKPSPISQAGEAEEKQTRFSREFARINTKQDLNRNNAFSLLSWGFYSCKFASVRG